MLTLDQFKCAQQFEDYLSDRSSVVHLEEILIFEDPFQRLALHILSNIPVISIFMCGLFLILEFRPDELVLLAIYLFFSYIHVTCI